MAKGSLKEQNHVKTLMQNHGIVYNYTRYGHLEYSCTINENSLSPCDFIE